MKKDMKQELSDIRKALNKEIAQLENRTKFGLLAAVDFINRQTERVEPLIPVDFGNLRASFNRIPFKRPAGPAIVFGYTASYAWWVHEMVDAKFKRPGAGAKYLQTVLERDQKEILKIIMDFAKIKTAGGKE